MSDPIKVLEALGDDAVRLDEIEKALDTATDLLDDAEQQWLEVYDTVAEALKDEMEKAGRKSDPAEHWITAQARRENRLVFTNWRRAKRAMDRLEKQLQAKRAAMSGRQSQLAAMRDEAKAPIQHAGPSGSWWDRQRQAAA